MEPSWEKCGGIEEPIANVVIGFGNTLRHDDAVGYLIADQVERWKCREVRGISVFQLNPELAAVLAMTRLAIFVDARAESPESGVLVEEIQPLAKGFGSLAHTIQPQWLLSFCQAAFDRCPRSWMISVPAQDFTFGEGLSAVAEQGMREALRAIAELIAYQGSLM
jgi:hydrogenase maturation protease